MKQKYEKLTYEKIEEFLKDLSSSASISGKLVVTTGRGGMEMIDKAMKAELNSIQDKQHQADLEEARRIINED